jgi:hypothetical protein
MRHVLCGRERVEDFGELDSFIGLDANVGLRRDWVRRRKH